ncbi:MAG: M20 family metallo-hydrolase [Bacteroidota bacterium]
MAVNLDVITAKAEHLLKRLISIPSLSREEDFTADLLFDHLKENGNEPKRLKNNVYAFSKDFDSDKPTVLLNSHHDTVKPAKGWTKDPFSATIENDRIYGLGSNDAGASLVCLLYTFAYLNEQSRDYNLIFAATAEEEISGKNGIELLLPELGKIDLGIVGEPTQMNLAVAEKGLMVLDVETLGESGHAAREEGENAIYKALKDIQWFRTFRFPKSSDLLGEVKMTVTQIQSGTQHNVVPDSCKFVVDVRTVETYSNQETLKIIKENVTSPVEARSTRLNSSGVELEHPIVKKGVELGMKTYGSPTLSDQALMAFKTIKIGPGDSARSHTADEYILKAEIRGGMEKYLMLLEGLKI